MLTTSSLTQRGAGQLSFQASVGPEFTLVPHSLFPLCQPPAARAFSLTGSEACGTSPSLLADFPSSSARTHRCCRAPHTPREAGPECPSHPPPLSFLISCSHSFKRPVAPHHLFVMLHACHLLLHFLLSFPLHLFFSHVLLPIFLHLPSSPPPVLLRQCAESINPHLGLAVERIKFPREG